MTIGGSIALIVTGAILRYAVNRAFGPLHRAAGLTMRSAARARSCRTGSVYAPGSSANTRYLKGSSCRWRSSAGGVRG